MIEYEIRSIQRERLEKAVQMLVAEWQRGQEKYGPRLSRHEGYGVLLEEVDELWDDIKGNSSMDKVQEEAIQVAAVAISFLTDFDKDQ